MRTPLLITSLTGVLILVGIGFAIMKKPAETPSLKNQPQSLCPDFNEGEITIDEKQLHVAIATTHEEKIHGLSGCGQLPENSGMLFQYNPPQEVAFWMKDMLMPIDIVWIRDGKVVGIEPAVPTPSPGTSTQNLPQYKSPGPVNSVLEIKSGGAGEHKIQIGSEVSQ